MLSVFLIPAALASGLDTPQVGTNLSGPTVSDPAAVYWNPGALAGLERPSVLLGAKGIVGRLGYQRTRQGRYPFADGLVFDDPQEYQLDPAKTGDADPVRAPLGAATADLFLAGPVPGTKVPVVLGGGVFVPYAAPLAFPYDGPQRWALQEVFLAVAEASMAAAVRVHPRVDVGISASYVFGFAELARAQDLAAVDLMAELLGNPPIEQDNDFGPSAPTTVREQDVLSRPFRYRQGVAHAGSFKAGLVARPHDRLVLAMAYDFGAPLKFRGPFSLDLNDPFFTEDLAARGVAYPAQVHGQGTLALRMPMRVRGGLTALFPAGRVDLMAEGVFWSAVQSFDLTLTSADFVLEDLGQGDTVETVIPRRWRNAVHVEVRTTIQASSRVRAAATVGYHSPASPDATVDVASPDGHRLLGALTAEVGIGRRQRVALIPDVEVQGILPRTITTSDHDLANGTYRLWMLGAGLHLQVSWGAEADRGDGG